MIKNILYATDLGAFAPHSLAHVESLAVQFDARVNIVHAVPPIGEFTAAVVRSHCSDQVKKEVLQSSHIKGLLESLRDEVFEMLASEPAVLHGLLPRVDDILILPGNPAGIILSEAERLRADMIVIGSHTANALDGRLLGSVATKILQLARVPVLLVPMMDPVTYGCRSNPGGAQFRA